MEETRNWPTVEGGGTSLKPSGSVLCVVQEISRDSKVLAQVTAVRTGSSEKMLRKTLER